METDKSRVLPNIKEVKQIADRIMELMLSSGNPSTSMQCLIAGIIFGAYEYAKNMDCIDEMRFLAFIEKLRTSGASSYMFNVIEAFTVSADRLALYINKADVIVSTIIEYRMRNEL